MEISNEEVVKIKELKRKYEALVIDQEAYSAFYAYLIVDNEALRLKLKELEEQYSLLQQKKKKFSILEWLLQK